MGITTEQYKKVMRFLDAEMDAAEMDEFEKELDANPAMRHQLNFEQSLRDNFVLQNITSLPGTIQAKEYTSSPAIPHKKTFGIQKWLALSAAVITACILIITLWPTPKKNPDVASIAPVDTAQEIINPPHVIATTPAKDSGKVMNIALLFKQYFKKDAIPEHYPMYLAEGLADYESGNYATLQQLNLKDLPQTRSIGETDSKENIMLLGHYYRGLAFLQTGNTTEAATNLDWVLQNQHSQALKAKAQWYLALTYLKENNKEKAAELCSNIINDKENKLLVKNAEEILNALGK
jgi:hypothetical protein